MGKMILRLFVVFALCITTTFAQQAVGQAPQQAQVILEGKVGPASLEAATEKGLAQVADTHPDNAPTVSAAQLQYCPTAKLQWYLNKNITGYQCLLQPSYGQSTPQVISTPWAFLYGVGANVNPSHITLNWGYGGTLTVTLDSSIAATIGHDFAFAFSYWDIASAVNPINNPIFQVLSHSICPQDSGWNIAGYLMVGSGRIGQTAAAITLPTNPYPLPQGQLSFYYPYPYGQPVTVGADARAGKCTTPLTIAGVSLNTTGVFP